MNNPYCDEPELIGRCLACGDEYYVTEIEKIVPLYQFEFESGVDTSFYCESCFDEAAGSDDSDDDGLVYILCKYYLDSATRPALAKEIRKWADERNKEKPIDTRDEQGKVHT